MQRKYAGTDFSVLKKKHSPVQFKCTGLLRFYLTSSSAIWMQLVAAPLRT